MTDRSNSSDADPLREHLVATLTSAQAALRAYDAAGGGAVVSPPRASKDRPLLHGGALLPLKDAAAELGVHQMTLIRWNITEMHGGRRYVRRERIEQIRDGSAADFADGDV